MEQVKEPLIFHELCSRLCKKIADDLIHVNGTEVLVTVEYYSSYFEVDRLTNETRSYLDVKSTCGTTWHGRPACIRQEETLFFSQMYCFEKVTSSPTYAQSNGKSENAVKTAKSFLGKAEKGEQGPYLSSMDWKNTPSKKLNSSPFQRWPTSNHLRKPKLPDGVEQTLKLQKAKTKLV